MGCDISPHNATELSPTQLAAIAALVGGASVADAAGRDRPDYPPSLDVRRRRIRRDVEPDEEGGVGRDPGRFAICRRGRGEGHPGTVHEPDTPPAVRPRAALVLIESVGGLGPEKLVPTTAAATVSRNEGYPPGRMPLGTD